MGMVKNIRKKIWRLRTTGFGDAFPAASIDCRNLREGPMAALAGAGRRWIVGDQRPVLFDVPVFRCRGLSVMAFCYLPSGNHPFVCTVREYMEGRCITAEGSAVDRYYRTWQPRTSSEIFGFERGDEPVWAKVESDIKAIPLPWENRRLSSFKKRERQAFGPASPRRLEAKFRKLTNLCDSVRRRGYQRGHTEGVRYAFEDIGGTVLVRDGDWRVLISKGQNRMAVVGALEMESIPISLSGVVFRDQVPVWPSVKNKMFTEKQALCVFDRVFSGIQPPRFNELIRDEQR